MPQIEKTNAVVLTATVNPNVEGWLVVADPGVRLTQYRASIAWWCQALEPTAFRLIVVETSGASKDDVLASVDERLRGGVDFVSFEPADELIARGKGAIEMEAIACAATSRNWLTDGSTVFKCTGRLPLQNAHRLLSEIPDNTVRLRMTMDRAWADTRFYGAQLSVWNELFFPASNLIDDDRSRDVERVVAAQMASALALHEIKLDRFTERPIFSGVSGTSGRSYSSRRSSIRARLLHPIESWLLRVAARKQL